MVHQDVFHYTEQMYFTQANMFEYLGQHTQNGRTITENKGRRV